MKKLPYLICIAVLLAALAAALVANRRQKAQFEQQRTFYEFQLSLLAGDYFGAAELAERLIAQNPGNTEMRVLRCALCKKCGDPQAEAIFDETIARLEAELGGEAFGEKSGEQELLPLMDCLMLAKLYGRNDLFDGYREKLAQLSGLEQLKDIAAALSTMNENEIFSMFNLGDNFGTVDEIYLDDEFYFDDEI